MKFIVDLIMSVHIKQAKNIRHVHKIKSLALMRPYEIQHNLFLLLSFDERFYPLISILFGNVLRYFHLI